MKWKLGYRIELEVSSLAAVMNLISSSSPLLRWGLWLQDSWTVLTTQSRSPEISRKFGATVHIEASTLKLYHLRTLLGFAPFNAHSLGYFTDTSIMKNSGFLNSDPFSRHSQWWLNHQHDFVPAALLSGLCNFMKWKLGYWIELAVSSLAAVMNLISSSSPLLRWGLWLQDSWTVLTTQSRSPEISQKFGATVHIEASTLKLYHLRTLLGFAPFNAQPWAESVFPGSGTWNACGGSVCLTLSFWVTYCDPALRNGPSNTSHNRNPELFITDVSGKYPRLWALKRVDPNDVQMWCNFGALALICTIAPSFWEISGLPDWVVNADQESWSHNPHLKRGKELEIKFITAASEDTTYSIRYPSFHFMKLQRLDKRVFTYIKEQETKLELVIDLTEDEISTRRA
ncbi:hypothetical protein ACS0TY_025732 [Phlomoides rotata]